MTPGDIELETWHYKRRALDDRRRQIARLRDDLNRESRALSVDYNDLYKAYLPRLIERFNGGTMTQQALANALGLNVSTVRGAMYEHGIKWI